MANFNKVLLVGNLTRDPELKHTLEPGGRPDRTRGQSKLQTKDGEKREETTFVDCEAWAARRKSCASTSPRVARLVEGRLKLDQWQDKDGNNRSKLKVVIENFQFLGGRGEGGQGGGQSNYAGSGNSGSSAQGGGGRLSDDPIPF